MQAAKIIPKAGKVAFCRIFLKVHFDSRKPAFGNRCEVLHFFTARLWSSLMISHVSIPFLHLFIHPFPQKHIAEPFNHSINCAEHSVLCPEQYAGSLGFSYQEKD